MTTEQTAQQLELAAQILRTGHPFEVRHDASDRWHASLGVNPAQAVLQDWHIRPVLATPPDNRPLHNPDNLTAEAVGVGYRLALPGESAASPHDFWDGDTWKKAKQLGPAIFAWCRRSCRLPLPVPWPEPADPYAKLKAAHAAGKVIQYRPEGNEEWSVCHLPRWSEPLECYRIKPTESAKPEPAFQLPLCAPGMRWHREDGWKADDLPSGYRPLVAGEKRQDSDDVHNEAGWLSFSDEKKEWPSFGSPDEEADSRSFRSRTTRPLTFTHAGKTWTWHRPGDPMPCDREARIEIVCHEGRTEQEDGIKYFPRLARNNIWRKTLGWRYADEKKTVPLGTEDVPPFSLLRVSGLNDPWNWMPVEAVDPCFGIRVISKEVSTSHEWLGWGDLKDREINRSIPLTGKWNPDAWEPCFKQIPA